MPTSISYPTVAEAIVKLYRIADTPVPSASQRIVRLHELLGGYNLTITELPQLTRQAAANFLLQHGVVLEPGGAASHDALAGFLYVSMHFGSMFVEQDDPVVRRRFSVAHELGHYLLHFQPLLQHLAMNVGQDAYEIMEGLPRADEDTDPDSVPTGTLLSQQDDLLLLLPPFEQMEHEANRFAAELLMPSDILFALATQSFSYLQGEELVWRLATELLVSQATMRWQLYHLGLIARPTTEQNKRAV